MEKESGSNRMGAQYKNAGFSFRSVKEIIHSNYFVDSASFLESMIC